MRTEYSVRQKRMASRKLGAIFLYARKLSAHIMLSLCRASGIPARYVSGYFFAEESPNLASHAWIDFCSDIDKGIWTSVDITHACLVDSRHIRLAIGRDYYSAAPVKGVRSGGGGEELSANISIQQLQ